MQGLRTGGPENDFTTDCYVLRNRPCANGYGVLLTSFSQKG
jgi:hypothetical protein